MKPSRFDYLRPRTVDEALAMLADHGANDGKLLAGGQSLVPMMNFRVAAPAVLIDLNGIADLAGISEDGDRIVIGAMTRHNDVKAHPLIARHAPLVEAAYHHVAHFTVRNRGTLGGNLVHADPASEMPMIMLVLGAEMHVASAAASRVVPAEEFFLGTYVTAIEEDELLMAISLPKRQAGQRHAFEEVSLRKGDFAVSAVGAVADIEDGRCRNLRLGLAGVSDAALLAHDVGGMLEGEMLTDRAIAAAGEAVVAGIEFRGTVSVSAEYRSDVTRELVGRCLRRIHEGAAE
ncbi:carbon-monoxide dehydrogenase medium subunit [Neorhizobium galegae]|uniref:FAD binding domain-containing protein n=1 Tax=Neorhizobium galegae TaxID=399 RepID=UPI00278A3E57|nr:FAD binding domain-containing protein [Neorhizobium galegae]MDQ0137731.1 carbon-monoxide dehydrogenase medium subunit [Neorhizobium galegae]